MPATRGRAPIPSGCATTSASLRATRPSTGRLVADVLVDSRPRRARCAHAVLSTASAQEDAMARYFRQWRKSDDQSAREWLGTNWDSLTPPQQERLVTESNRRVIPR
ncbi:MAG: hypothetical protein R3F11_28655 [Verrucomicrobiales bacterium]